MGGQHGITRAFVAERNRQKAARKRPTEPTVSEPNPDVISDDTAFVLIQVGWFLLALVILVLCTKFMHWICNRAKKSMKSEKPRNTSYIDQLIRESLKEMAVDDVKGE